MRKSLIALGAVALLASLSGAAGLGVGESAPLPEAKESIGLSNYSAKALEGKVVYLEIFRTW
jgi:hypothetical protein